LPGFTDAEAEADGAALTDLGIMLAGLTLAGFSLTFFDSFASFPNPRKSGSFGRPEICGKLGKAMALSDPYGWATLPTGEATGAAAYADCTENMSVYDHTPRTNRKSKSTNLRLVVLSLLLADFFGLDITGWVTFVDGWSMVASWGSRDSGINVVGLAIVTAMKRMNTALSMGKGHRGHEGNRKKTHNECRYIKTSWGTSD